MNQDEAVDFIIRQYTIGRSPTEIVEALSRQLGAPNAVVEKFVHKTITQAFPERPVPGIPPAVADAPRNEGQKPADDGMTDLSAGSSLDDEDEIYPETVSPMTGLAPADYVVGEARQVASASVFLTGRLPDEVDAPSPPSITDAPGALSDDEMRRLEKDPDLNALILKLAGRNIKQSEIVMMVCERNNLDWKDAQRITARIMARNRKTIATRQNVYLIPFSALIILAGAALLVAGIGEFLRLRTMYVQTDPNLLMLNEAQYILRGVLPWALVGLGLLAGGVFGLIKAIQSRNN